MFEGRVFSRFGENKICIKGGTQKMKGKKKIKYNNSCFCFAEVHSLSLILEPVKGI